MNANTRQSMDENSRQQGFMRFSALRASREEPDSAGAHAKAQMQGRALGQTVIARKRFDDALRELEQMERDAQAGKTPEGVDAEKWKRLQWMKSRAAMLERRFPLLPGASGLHGEKSDSPKILAASAVQILRWQEDGSERLALRFSQPHTFMNHKLALMDAQQGAPQPGKEEGQKNPVLVERLIEFDGVHEPSPSGPDETIHAGIGHASGAPRAIISRSALFYGIQQGLMQALYEILERACARHAPALRVHLLPMLMGVPQQAAASSGEGQATRAMQALLLECQWFLTQVYFHLEENFALTLELKNASQMTAWAGTHGMQDRKDGIVPGIEAEEMDRLAVRIRQCIDRQWISARAQQMLRQEKEEKELESQKAEAGEAGAQESDDMSVLQGFTPNDAQRLGEIEQALECSLSWLQDASLVSLRHVPFP